MSGEEKIMRNFSSKIIFFDSSSEDAVTKDTLDKVIKKIEQSGFQVNPGDSSHLTLDISRNPDMTEVAAIVLNAQNAHDAAGMKSLIKNYPHTHIFCICDETQKNILRAGHNGNISTYSPEVMSPKEIYLDIASKLRGLTTLKQGNVLFFDPAGIFSEDREILSQKGICVDIAKSHEELETKIEFHQSKIDAVVLDADERAEHLIRAAKNVNAQTIVVLPADQLSRAEIQDADYQVIKNRRGYNSNQLQIFIDKCIVPRVQMTKSATEVDQLVRKSPFGYLVYIMGPSLTGKTTISKNLAFSKSADYIQFVPKYSTRPLRTSEEQGADIISVSLEEFNRLSADNKFFHEFVYRDNKYGVPQAVPDYLRKGKHVIQINPCFEQFKEFAQRIQEEFNHDLVVPILLFGDKETLENRLSSIDAPAEEIELRKSKLDSELFLFNMYSAAFKYHFFSHNTQDPVELTKRLAAIIRWEEANSDASYNKTHRRYINIVLEALTDRSIEDLPKNSLQINMTKQDIAEFCQKNEITDSITAISNFFPLKLTHIENPHHGRIGLYIKNHKRYNPAERRIILEVINHMLSKYEICPKVSSKWNSYHKESMFGLIEAVDGELCDGALYTLTDENKLYSVDSSPIMLSVGFAKDCEGKIFLRGMNTSQITNLAEKIKPVNAHEYEFVHAVRENNKSA